MGLLRCARYHGASWKVAKKLGFLKGNASTSRVAQLLGHMHSSTNHIGHFRLSYVYFNRSIFPRSQVGVSPSAAAAVPATIADTIGN